MKTNENESRRNPKKMFTRAQEDKYTTIIITYTTRRYALYSPRAASIRDIPRWDFPDEPFPACIDNNNSTLVRFDAFTHAHTLLRY